MKIEKIDPIIGLRKWKRDPYSKKHVYQAQNSESGVLVKNSVSNIVKVDVKA